MLVFIIVALTGCAGSNSGSDPENASAGDEEVELKFMMWEIRRTWTFITS